MSTNNNTSGILVGDDDSDSGDSCGPTERLAASDDEEELDVGPSTREFKEVRA